MKIHKYYYFSEQKDDFANTGIRGKNTPEDFSYLPKNALYRLMKPIVYYTILFLGAVILKAILGVPVQNARVLRNRKEKKKGYFIYSNHTSRITDALSAPVTAFPRPCYTVAHPDAISIKGTRLFIRMCGALPVPSFGKTYRTFNQAIATLYRKGAVISIFPEAHIWPKYPKIRDFSSVSFTYPVKLHAPCFARTTVYRKQKNGKTRPLILYDGPFYPDESLPTALAIEELRNRIYTCMVNRTKKYNSSVDRQYEYIPVDAPEKVRCDTTRIETESL